MVPVRRGRIRAKMMVPGKIVCIVGPTATGKSELAQIIAERFNGEVVSADSMQIYRGMDIGTAKVPLDERRVPHFGLDLVDPGEAYSVALYQEYARAAFDDILSRGKLPVLVGGSGFYVRAAIDDYDFPKGEQLDNPIRERFERLLKEKGNVALWKKLEEVDPASAKVIHPNNAKRVIRALEMHDEGISYAEQVQRLQTIDPYMDAVMVGLACPKEVLDRRISLRVDKMREMGLESEVRGLLDAGFRDGLTSQHAIGYKEIVDAFEGGRSMDRAYEDIKQATRRYAKRQRTWFRKDERIDWLDCVDPMKAASETVDLVGEKL